MLSTVRLYGKLGKLFGRTWHLDVNSPREAVMAIDANMPGFSAYLVRNSLPGYHVVVGGHDRDESELELQTKGREIKIIPYVKGRNTGWGRIILGVVLVVVGAYVSTWGWWAGGSMWGPSLVGMGLNMIMGGVVQLLTRPPTLDQPSEREGNRPSYIFDGPVNTTAQGWPMPVGYGICRVGGALASMAITTEDYIPGMDDDPNAGTYRILNLNEYLYASEGEQYDIELLTASGTPPYVWSLVSQTPGTYFAVIESGGAYYIQPTSPVEGLYTLVVQVVDDGAATLQKTIKIRVDYDTGIDPTA